MATITVTGVDEGTSFEDVQFLAGMPRTEVGFLYTKLPEGRNRYPSREWLARAMPLAAGRAALHVCGGRARAELVAGDLADLVLHAARIQVNGGIKVAEVERICALFPGHVVITQHKPENAKILAVEAPNHALLVDGSGGRGLAPEGWVRPASTKQVGFAGGLGPSTLPTELPLIQAVADGEWWVDMEGNLRIEDWFNAVLAVKAITIFNDSML